MYKLKTRHKLSNYSLFNYSVVLFVAVSPEEEQAHFEEFFEDVFVECEDKVNEIINSLLLFSPFSLSPHLHLSFLIRSFI